MKENIAFLKRCYNLSDLLLEVFYSLSEFEKQQILFHSSVILF